MHTFEAMKADGEWLYELDAIEATDPFLEPNRAMLALMEGSDERCAEMLETQNALVAKRRNSAATNANNNAQQSRSSIHAFNESLSSAGVEHHTFERPAWAIVRSHLYSSRDAAERIVDKNPIHAMAHHCNLPWVMFQQ